MTEKGILKVKKAFERLKEFSVISFLASASLTVVATLFMLEYVLAIVARDLL